jgi:hypothetical protein
MLKKKLTFQDARDGAFYVVFENCSDVWAHLKDELVESDYLEIKADDLVADDAASFELASLTLAMHTKSIGNLFNKATADKLLREYYDYLGTIENSEIWLSTVEEYIEVFDAALRRNQMPTDAVSEKFLSRVLRKPNTYKAPSLNIDLMIVSTYLLEVDNGYWRAIADKYRLVN